MIASARLRKMWSAAWPYLLLALFCVGFFWDSLLLHKAPLMRDMLCDHVPYRALQARVLWSGHLPLWNPLSGGGQPFLGEPQCMPLYPLHIVFDIFPLVAALKLSLVMHLFIAASGACALARAWRCSKPASVIAGLAFAFGTCQLAWMEYLISLSTLVWIPWVLRIAHGVASRAGPFGASGVWSFLLNVRASFARVVLFAVVLSMQYLGGHAELFLFSCVILAFYALISLPAELGWKAALRSWQGLALGALIALLWTAPDWLMLLQHAALSVREAGFDPREHEASVHPMHWLTLLLPYLFGRPGYPDKYWAKDIFEFWVGTCYVGIVPVLLALVALCTAWFSGSENRRATRGRMAFLAVTLLMGILLDSGECTPVFGFFHRNIPGFTRMRWPSKTLVFVHFALSLLAAMGATELFGWLSRIPTEKRSKAWWIAASLLFAVTAALAAALIGEIHSPAIWFQRLTFGLATTTTERTDNFKHQIIFALSIAAIATAVVCSRLRRLPHCFRALALVAVVYVDLFHVGRQMHPILPDDLYHFSPEIVQSEIGGPSELKRIHSNYGGIQQFLYASSDAGLIDAAKKVAAGNIWLHETVENDWSGGLQLENYAKVYFLFPQLTDEQANRLADLMSVTHLIAPTDRPDMWRGEDPRGAKIFTRPHPLPRASLLNHWIIPSTWLSGAQLLLSPQFDPTFNGILQNDENENPPPPFVDSYYASTGKIESIQYDWDRVDIALNTTGPMLLLLTDTWYPGWKAHVDGKNLPIYRANLTFRGVILPAGAKHVTFTYEPYRFTVGVQLSVTAIVIVLGSLLLIRFTNKKSRGRNSAALTAVPI